MWVRMVGSIFVEVCGCFVYSFMCSVVEYVNFNEIEIIL